MHKKEFHDNAVAVAKFAPLLAAVIAPFVILYAVPATSQHWYSDATTGDGLPDPPHNLALSGTSLAASIVALGLLLGRFSFSRHWRLMTTIST